MRHRVVGIGAGGHARVVLEALRLSGAAEVVGLLDTNRDTWGSEVLGVPVLGGDDQLPRLLDEGVGHVFIGIGSVGDSTLRRRAYERAKQLGFEVMTTISPSAHVSPSATLGSGATLLPHCVVHALASLGENVIVNSGAVVEHDSVIENHVHIATGAHLASGVVVGEGAHVGVGAAVRQGIRIGDNAIVGAGAVVVKDVEDNVVVVGNPAQLLRGDDG